MFKTNQQNTIIRLLLRWTGSILNEPIWTISEIDLLKLTLTNNDISFEVFFIVLFKFFFLIYVILDIFISYYLLSFLFFCYFRLNFQLRICRSWIVCLVFVVIIISLNICILYTLYLNLLLREGLLLNLFFL